MENRIAALRVAQARAEAAREALDLALHEASGALVHARDAFAFADVSDDELTTTTADALRTLARVQVELIEALELARDCCDGVADDFQRDMECQGHPAGAFDPQGVTVYCDGTCRQRR